MAHDDLFAAFSPFILTLQFNSTLLFSDKVKEKIDKSAVHWFSH